MPFDSMGADVDIVDGTVSLHPVFFGIGQGRLTVNGTLAPQEGGGLRAKLDIELRRADLSRLLGAAGAGGRRHARRRRPDRGQRQVAVRDPRAAATARPRW